MHEHEPNGLFQDKNLLPVRRLFERQWENQLTPDAPRVDGFQRTRLKSMLD